MYGANSYVPSGSFCAHAIFQFPCEAWFSGSGLASMQCLVPFCFGLLFCYILGVHSLCIGLLHVCVNPLFDTFSILSCFFSISSGRETLSFIIDVIYSRNSICTSAISAMHFSIVSCSDHWVIATAERHVVGSRFTVVYFEWCTRVTTAFWNLRAYVLNAFVFLAQ